MQFGCMGNSISSLNLNNNIHLERLWCDNNQLTSLDLTKNTKLNVVKCSNNNLTGNLDISKIESLRNLDIDLRLNPRLNIIEVPQGFILFAENNNRILKDPTAQWVEKP